MRKVVNFLLLLSVVLLVISGCESSLIGLGPAADVNNPEGSFDNLENGDYVRGNITLSGSSSDDVKIESVKALINNEILEAELERGVSTDWSIPVDTTLYPDGEYTVVLTITDSSGRETEKRLLLYFDNTAPTVVVTSTTGISSGASTNFPVIRGEAYDYLFSSIARVEARVVSGSADVISLQGTNGWSFTLQTTGTGTYGVRITAYDKAGNSNTWLYHGSDFPSDIQIEDIAASETKGSVGGINLLPLRMAEQDIEVDLSLDEPGIVVSNPEEGKTAAQNIMGGTSVAVGYIEDDDEVDTGSVELSLDGGTTWTGLSGGQLSGSGGFIRWSYDLSALDNGVYSLQVKADDAGKASGEDILTGYSAIVPFTIDKTAPSVTISSPGAGAYLSSGDFTITGDAEDTGGSIVGITVSVNGNSPQNASFVPGETVSWSYSVTGAAAGAVNIEVEAEDNSGKTSHHSMQVYVDETDPGIEFLSPAEDAYINGTASLQGVSSDNWSLQQVKLQIGGLAWDPAAAEVFPPAEFYSWQRDIVSSVYENTGMAVEVNGSGVPESGTGIWELTIWAEAVDKAGNSTLSSHRLYIDNSLDRPGVNIASPADGAVLAGSVMLSGSAWDDKNESGEDIDHIEVRIWKGEDSAGGTVYNNLFDLNSLLGLDDVYGDGSWYRISGTGTWGTELNAVGEFYPDGTVHNGTVKVDVRAVDQKDGTPDLAGNIESIEVTFDDTVPYFDNLSHSSGDYEKGTFTLSGDVNDDDSVERLRISYNGGVSWSVIDTDMGASAGFSTSVDTVSLIGNSGILYLRLEALDNANYRTIQSINLYIDNLDPSGTFTSSTADLAGTALVQGTAVDSGTVSGVDYIEVSFSLDGVPVTPLDMNGLRTPIIIDSRIESGDDSSANGDGDGYDESMSISGSTWSWWAQFDSTSLDDGSLDVVYTVYDYSGNSFSDTVSGGNIKNHAPQIDSIDAGWDHDHDGSIEVGEVSSYTADLTESNAVFGDLSYSFSVDYDGLNGAESYGIRVRPLPAGSWTDLGSVSSSGILDTASGAVFTSGDGIYEIEFSVSDPKGYEDLLTLGIEVENTDSEDPVMDFYELTESDAAAVKTAGTGHIEVDGSIYLSGMIPFSGRAEDNQRIESIAVSIDGAAAVTFVEWDTADDRLEYSSDGSALGGGSGFISDGGTLLHRADWSWDWDSAQLPAGLGTDVSFIVTDAAGRTHQQTHTYDVVPYISSIDTMLSGAFSATLARSALGKYPVLTESAQSAFETITLHGWNLDSAAATSTAVRISSDPDALEADGVTQRGTLLAHTDGTAGDGELSVAADSAGSGYLTVIVDGVASRNNINTNSKTYNTESSTVHQSLSDDRYLSVWDSTRLWRDITLADHAEYPSMIMSGDVPHFVYVNNSEGFGQAYYLAGTTNNLVIKNWDLLTYTAVGLNSDGNHAALADVNVVNGNFGDYNAGNYGGIFMNFFYDVPDHAWGNYDWLDNGIWLENLVDTSSATTAVLNRYQYPDIKVLGTTETTDVFYSVYDVLTGQLVFRHFLVGTSNTIDDVTGGRINNSGTALFTDVIQQENDGTYPEYNGDNRFANAGSAQPGATPAGAQVLSTSSAIYSAVGATGDASTALIAYNDTSGSGQLLFRYNESPDNSGTWSTGISVENFISAEYIDMAVDSSDRIHLAYYDSYSGDLKYAYIPAYDSSEASVEVYTVDSYLIVGSKLSITVDASDNVIIAYKGLGNSSRAAWLAGSSGDGASGDRFTGSWEIQTIPDLISDSDSNRFNIGADTAGLPVVGYTEDGLEYARLLGELAD